MSQKIETAEIEEYSPGEKAQPSIAIPSGPITYIKISRFI